MFYLSAKFETDLSSHSEVMNTNMSEFWEFFQIFGKNRPIFLLKIMVLKIWKHGPVAVDVCFYEKPPYQWSDACPEFINTSISKFSIFMEFSAEKVPYFR